MGGWQWFHEPIRLVHTILRTCDVPGYDARAYLDYAERMRGNTVVINGGGLYAFYPTRIERHHVVPGLTTDVAGDVVEEAHKRGIKVLARVDFRGRAPGHIRRQPRLVQLRRRRRADRLQWVLRRPGVQPVPQRGLRIPGCPRAVGDL